MALALPLLGVATQSSEQRLPWREVVEKEGRESLNNLWSQVWGGMPASLIAQGVSL